MYDFLTLPTNPLTLQTDVWIDGDGGLRSKTTVRPLDLPSPSLCLTTLPLDR